MTFNLLTADDSQTFAHHNIRLTKG